MDIRESPTQTAQSHEEDKEAFSGSELLDSPDEEEERLLSDSEVVQEDENVALIEEDQQEIETHERSSELEERGGEDEVVPDYVSDLDDEDPQGETEGMGQEDGTIMLVEGDEDCPQAEQFNGGQKENNDQEERVIDTPLSPDSEQGLSFIAEEDGEEGYSVYQKATSSRPTTAEMNEEGDKDKSNAKGDEKDDRKRAMIVSEMQNDSVSVSRELDEHELDYDEEVPEEPIVPLQEEEEEEEDTNVEGHEKSEDKSCKKKEKKTILPPSPKDGELKRTDSSKWPERARTDAFRDKKKDEDDGEIDEGEIDVSDKRFL